MILARNIQYINTYYRGGHFTDSEGPGDFENYCLLIWKKNCGLDALIVSNLCVIMYNRDICLRAISTYFLNVTGKAVWMPGRHQRIPDARKNAEAKSAEEDRLQRFSSFGFCWMDANSWTSSVTSSPSLRCSLPYCLTERPIGAAAVEGLSFLGWVQKPVSGFFSQWGPFVSYSTKTSLNYYGYGRLRFCSGRYKCLVSRSHHQSAITVPEGKISTFRNRGISALPTTKSSIPIFSLYLH